MHIDGIYISSAVARGYRDEMGNFVFPPPHLSLCIYNLKNVDEYVYMCMHLMLHYPVFPVCRHVITWLGVWQSSVISETYQGQ